MKSGTLLYITEVLPYARSEKRPDDQRRLAGAHHCLPETIISMRQIAQLVGLGFAHFESVTEIAQATLDDARVLALFTIGETPWSSAQKATIISRIRSGAMGFM